MNRTRLALAVALGLTMTGCAADVADPVPPAPVPEEQRDPPTTAKEAELRNLEIILVHAARIPDRLDLAAVEQVPHGPYPPPEK